VRLQVHQQSEQVAAIFVAVVDDFDDSRMIAFRERAAELAILSAATSPYTSSTSAS